MRNQFSSYIHLVVLTGFIFFSLCLQCPGLAQTVVFSRAPLTEGIQEMLRGIGLEYQVTAEPVLEGYFIPADMQLQSLTSLFDHILPALGLTYDMQGARSLHLLPLQSPWDGPQDPEQKIPAPLSNIRQPVQLSSPSPETLVSQLEGAYGVPLLLDYRIPSQRPIQTNLEANSLLDALLQLQAGEGWNWFSVERMIVILPSPEDRLLGLANWHNQRWIYAGTPLEEILQELASVFKVNFEVADSLATRPVTGLLQGATLDEVLFRLAALSESSYTVAEGKIYLAPAAEIKPLAQAPTGTEALPSKILLELEILEVPERRWKELRVSNFLLSIPPATSEEQAAFFDRVKRTSGVRTFGKSATLIEDDVETALDFPFDEKRTGVEAEAGYFIRMRPTAARTNWLLLTFSMLFRELPRPEDRNKVIPPSIMDRPVRGEILVENRSTTLLHGAIRRAPRRQRDGDSIFLIAVKPTLQEDGISGAHPSASGDQPRWYLPSRIEVGGEVRVMGVHTSGLPGKTRKITGHNPGR